MTQQAELEQAWNNAHSIRGGKSGLQYIGSRKERSRIFVFYKGSDGQYWYETKYQEAHGTVSEFEHVFGHQEQKGRKGTAWKNYSK